MFPTRLFVYIIIIIRVSRFQFGSNWQSLTVNTVDLSSRVTFLQAVRQDVMLDVYIAILC